MFDEFDYLDWVDENLENVEVELDLSNVNLDAVEYTNVDAIDPAEVL